MSSIHASFGGHPILGGSPERPRRALVLDLENLLHPFRREGELPQGLDSLCEVLQERCASSTIVSAVGICDADLARRSAWRLRQIGVRVHPTRETGPNAADFSLIDHLRHDLPRSVDHVTIGSGDHAFAAVAQVLRSGGRFVDVIALESSLSADLYVSVDAVALLRPTLPLAA